MGTSLGLDSLIACGPGNFISVRNHPQGYFLVRLSYSFIFQRRWLVRDGCFLAWWESLCIWKGLFTVIIMILPERSKRRVLKPDILRRNMGMDDMILCSYYC